MSYSPLLGSSFNRTSLRDPAHTSSSGMCSMCTADCIGSCEIGLSAILGANAVYPTTTGKTKLLRRKFIPLTILILTLTGAFSALSVQSLIPKKPLFITLI